jgi:hypothetical protein
MRGLAVVLVAALTVAASVRWGSFVAGGSDSYCYLAQAERWADAIRRPLAGQLQVVEPLALEAPWPDAALTFTPVGHTPSTLQPGAIAPVCPSGLSMLMAPFVVVGGRAGAFAVVPLMAGLLVVATYFAGSRFGARIGLVSAVLVAASPIVLYQAVQPMSDVPAAALWMAAVAAATATGRWHAAWSGLAAAAAILVRPNLLPLGVAIGLYLLFRPERTWRQRVAGGGQYAACAAVGCAGVALVQQMFFGSAFDSGYGSLDTLFSADNLAANARLYVERLWQAHTPAIFLAALAPFLLPGALAVLFLAMAVANLAVYLPYLPFPEWSYLRFLLPTLPLLLILLAAAVDAVAARAWLRLRRHRRSAPYVHSAAAPAVALILALVLAPIFLRKAVDRQVFRLQRLEARFERTGRYVAERLPANALVLTTWHSGSVRYYSGRKTLVWDVLDPAWLDRALVFARARGYEPYFLFEGQEERAFRTRFSGSPLGALDWPPAAEIAGQVRVYRPADQETYRLGAARPTEYVR